MGSPNPCHLGNTTDDQFVLPTDRVNTFGCYGNLNSKGSGTKLVNYTWQSTTSIIPEVQITALPSSHAFVRCATFAIGKNDWELSVYSLQKLPWTFTCSAKVLWDFLLRPRLRDLPALFWSPLLRTAPSFCGLLPRVL